eukprot:9088502-Pyramimonas_sp.AAC.1
MEDHPWRTSGLGVEASQHSAETTTRGRGKQSAWTFVLESSTEAFRTISPAPTTEDQGGTVRET